MEGGQRAQGRVRGDRKERRGERAEGRDKGRTHTKQSRCTAAHTGMRHGMISSAPQSTHEFARIGERRQWQEGSVQKGE